MAALRVTWLDIAIRQRALRCLQREVPFLLPIVMATHAATFQDWSNAIAKQVFGVGARVCEVQAAGRQNDDKNHFL